MESAPLALQVAIQSDAAFIYEVCCQSIRPYAEQAFGTWPADIVLANVQNNISAGLTQIIFAQGKRVGILTVQQFADHVQLDQLFLLPAFQRRGFGTELTRTVLLQAKQLGVPVRLRVLKVNPAKRLYERLGFFVTAEEPERFYMQSAP